MTLAVRNLVIQDADGNLMAGASIEVRLDVQGKPLAAIYSDRAGLVPLENPFETDDGKASFFALGGAYQIKATLGDFEDIQNYVPIGRGAETDLSVVTPRGTYSAVVSYNAGDLVTHTVAGSGLRGFISLQNSNLNHTPPSTTPIVDTAYWQLSPGTTTEQAEAILDGATTQAGIATTQAGLAQAAAIVSASSSVSPALRYAFDTGTAGAGIGAGELRGNNATLASWTTIFANDNAVQGDVSAYANSIFNGGPAIKGHVIGVNPQNETQFFIFAVTGYIDQAGYTQFTGNIVSYGNSFADGAPLVIQYLRAGDGGAFDDLTYTGAGFSHGQGVVYDAVTQKLVPKWYREYVEATETRYCRAIVGDVSISNASPAVVTKTGHLVQANDPIVFAILPNKAPATLTIASPAVGTLVNHGYAVGQPIKWSTTGTLPTGVTALQTYYVIAAGLTSDNFQFSATPGGAAVNTSVSQSGTHYIERTGTMPTGTVAGTIYYAKTILGPDTFTFSATPGGAAINTSGAQAGIVSCATGNDNNDGRTNDRAGAFLTPQNAYKYLHEHIDAGAALINVQCADSHYTSAGTMLSIFGYPPPGPASSQTPIVFIGNVVSPSNCKWIAAAACVQVTYGGSAQVRGFYFESTGAYSCYASAQGKIVVQGLMEWGPASLAHMNGNMGGIIIYATSAAIVSGGALIGHLYVSNGGLIESNVTTTTILNTPNFPFGYCRFLDGGIIRWNSSTFVGNTTGPRFVGELNGQFTSSNSTLTTLPGSSPGRCLSGARYMDYFVWSSVVKPADEATTSDTTFSDDNALTFTAAANAIYVIKGRIFFNTTATADFKWQLTGPAAPTLLQVAHKAVAGGATALSNIANDNAFSTVDAVLGSGIAGYIEFEALLQNGANAGAVRLQWAQNTTDANPTTVRGGSSIEYMKAA